MEYFYKLDELPTVKDAVKMPYNDYLKHAKGVLEFKEYCQMGLVESVEKVHEWCKHLRCLSVSDVCEPAPPEATLFKHVPLNSTMSPHSVTISTLLSSALVSTLNQNATAIPRNKSVFEFLQNVGYNNSKYYDDYVFDHVGLSMTNHYLLGFGCLLLCLYGIISNLVLLPAYNIGLNRSGATIYLSAMSIFDIAYLALTLIIVVARYLPANFTEQMETYATFSARFVPIGAPVMMLCELVVLWLVVGLLANRLLYLKFGCQSKCLCSQLQSIKSVTALVVFGLTYASCKMLEYTLIEYKEMNVVRVVLTPIGNTSLYKNLMYHWLKVPLQMFLPYLSVGILVSVVVTKMLNLHASKWKAVASLCNDTACACVCRTGVCGNDCQEGVTQDDNWPSTNLPERVTDTEPKVAFTDNPTVHEKQPTAKLVAPDHAAGDTMDPIEEELAYLFFQAPKVDETREHANVITAVCVGLLLILFKVPKFFLHVLATEHYINYDPAVFTLIDQFMDTMFAACKPTVCILVGAHFRRALLAPPTCECYSRPERSGRAVRAARTAAKTLQTTPTKSADVQLAERSAMVTDYTPAQAPA